MSFHNHRKPKPFKIPRVVRSKGYRSKGPARDAVSSYAFSGVDLSESVVDGALVLRGNTTVGARLEHVPGSLMPWACTFNRR